MIKTHSYNLKMGGHDFGRSSGGGEYQSANVDQIRQLLGEFKFGNEKELLQNMQNSQSARSYANDSNPPSSRRSIKVNKDQQQSLSANLEFRPEQILPTNVKYEGQWIPGTMIREGRGRQIWKDGSLYEGWFKNDKAQGFGRLIHADGDVYEG